MKTTDEQKLEKLKDRYKRQNDRQKEKYVHLTTVVEKSVKERIEAVTDENINTFLKRLIFEELERLENSGLSDFGELEELPPFPHYEPEPKAEPQKEDAEIVEKMEEKPKKVEFKPITPEQAAELEALIKNQLDKQKAHAEKLEQDKQKRIEAEQAAKEAEIMGYVEKMRAAQDGIRETRNEQDKKKIAAVLADAELLAIIREPSNRDCLVEQVGEDLYNAILQADREKQRQESIDRASAEVGQAGKPPF